MLSHFLPPFIASLLAATITTIGIITIRYFEEWGRKYVVYFSSFAAGVLISVSFLRIIPESFDKGMTECLSGDVEDFDVWEDE